MIGIIKKVLSLLHWNGGDGNAQQEEAALDRYTETLTQQRQIAANTHDVLARLVSRLQEHHV